MNKIALTIVVMFTFMIIVLSLNAFPWYLSLIDKNQEHIDTFVLTKDNILLSVSYIKPKNPDSIVILIHDYGEDKQLWWTLGLPQRLINYDSITVLFDLRFHGNSTPVLSSRKPPFITLNTTGYITDLETIIEWSRRTLGNYPIILVGYGEVCQVNTKYILSLNNTDNIKGIVLILPPDNTLNSIGNKEFPQSIKVLVMSDNIAWRYKPVTFIQVKVSRDNMVVLNEKELDLLFNWIKDVTLK